MAAGSQPLAALLSGLTSSKCPRRPGPLLTALLNPVRSNWPPFEDPKPLMELFPASRESRVSVQDAELDTESRAASQTDWPLHRDAVARILSVAAEHEMRTKSTRAANQPFQRSHEAVIAAAFTLGLENIQTLELLPFEWRHIIAGDPFEVLQAFRRVPPSNTAYRSLAALLPARRNVERAERDEWLNTQCWCRR